MDWSEVVWQSSRANVTATFVSNHWLTAGTIYGEPEGPLHPQFQAHNQRIIHEVAVQVCHLSVGLRMIGGDFNLECDSVPAFQLIRNAGFRDIQEIAQERFGTSIRPTSKQARRRDYLFLSPEMQQLLVSAQVIDDIWPDHSVLQLP